jgi:hypothetical protein
MALDGAGAGLIHSLLSGAMIALAPPEAAGLTSGLLVVLSQGGFAIGIAALGATSRRSEAGDFAATFSIAAFAAAAGAIASLCLIDRKT